MFFFLDFFSGPATIFPAFNYPPPFFWFSLRPDWIELFGSSPSALLFSPFFTLERTSTCLFVPFWHRPRYETRPLPLPFRACLLFPNNQLPLYTFFWSQVLTPIPSYLDLFLKVGISLMSFPFSCILLGHPLLTDLFASFFSLEEGQSLPFFSPPPFCF